MSINMSYEEMQNEANQLKAGQDRITQELNILLGRIQNLVSGGFVTEHSSGMFMDSYQRFDGGAKQTVAALTDLANELNRIVANFQNADRA